jgi:hypothetical protein
MPLKMFECSRLKLPKLGSSSSLQPRGKNLSPIWFKRLAGADCCKETSRIGKVHPNMLENSYDFVYSWYIYILSYPQYASGYTAISVYIYKLRHFLRSVDHSYVVPYVWGQESLARSQPFRKTFKSCWRPKNKKWCRSQKCMHRFARSTYTRTSMYLQRSPVSSLHRPAGVALRNPPPSHLSRVRKNMGFQV